MVRSMVPRRMLFIRDWEPLEEVDRLMDRFFPFQVSPLRNVMRSADEQPWFAPPVDVSETDELVEVTVELPGMKPEQFHVEVKEGDLWISGETEEKKEEKGKTFHRMERHFGQFRRVLPLPESIKSDEIVAEYHDGVLHIQVPRIAGESESKTIEVKT